MLTSMTPVLKESGPLVKFGHATFVIQLILCDFFLVYIGGMHTYATYMYTDVGYRHTYTTLR